MGYRVLTGDGTIAADTAEEAFALLRQIRETGSAPPAAPPSDTAPPPLACRTFDADDDFSEFWPDLVLPPEPAEPEPDVDFNLGRLCRDCGRPGHVRALCPGDDDEAEDEAPTVAPEPRERRTFVAPEDLGPDEPLLPVERLLRFPDGTPRISTIPGDRRLTDDEKRAVVSLDYPDVKRPKTWGDCASELRPCPWVSCAFHLYLDVDPKSGAIKFNRPELQVHEMPETCCLDVADRGGETLDGVGQLLGVSRERVRQVENGALKVAARHATDLEPETARGARRGCREN
ncbi:MAG: hypothetical protein EPN98_21770 [Phenylobacterium sp.]|uniref:sigma factor-like helix-turn-helix DNA-binding protein n=1 Tax=Phenylobacterium sp. TaxID=1871053 RepID=UPI001227A3C9|nr:sigma factor-like helix-turn-helix DNA-binding protein [Phenylobacterium sp.]TAL29073.1 MAG: hypothetical protein EPN98_21770 [Phenylobacterium sp.]